MNVPRAEAWLGIALVAIALGSLLVYAHFRMALDPDRPALYLRSTWRRGELLARVASTGAPGAGPTGGDGVEVVEAVIGQGPLATWPEIALSLSLVPGHDGVSASLEGRTVYVTPDDLLAHRAYDRGASLFGVDLMAGFDPEVLFALLAERLETTAPAVRDRARLTRLRIAPAASAGPGPAWSKVDESTLSDDDLRGAALDAARYLARNTKTDGHFRYLVDARTGAELPGYDWPRHAGATYFLAQAAARFHESDLATACLRAASLMRDRAVVRCGAEACIGDEPRVDLGSTALAVLAFVEIARTGLDPTYAGLVSELARFLRRQQRRDGEFMHEYDRDAKQPVDVQYPYYSGEASLALARARGVDGDGEDLTAAARGLEHLVGPAWSFFGDRYYFGEEHWTCQAMAELWASAPNPRALDFCARWQENNREMQYGANETPFDADGALGIGPLVTPRLTPVASRCEAGVATLEVLRKRADPATAELEAQMRRSLALLVRRQLRPGPVAVMADPDAVYGAMPGSEIDLALRIDYAQHAGSAFLRWLDRERPLNP